MTPRPEIAAARFGYGLPLPAGAPAEPAAMLAALVGPDAAAAAFPGPPPAEARAAIASAHAVRTALRRDRSEANRDALHAARLETRRITDAGLRASLLRALAAPDGLRERLVRFWAGHFAVSARLQFDGPLPFLLAEEAIRPHVAGRFADMLRAVTLHPAMLAFLDQPASVGPGSAQGQRRGRGLNENLARELMELHTLGSGAPYTQDDVREMAELLTGLTITPEVATGFEPGSAEPGPETVLGRRYAGEGLAPVEAMLDDLAARPETAGHIARKLAVHFVADEPDPGLVTALAGRFAETGGDLAAVIEALLGHPAAWAPDLGKVRQPFDFLAAGMRALAVAPERLAGMPAGRFRRLVQTPLRLMGQPWQEPPGPDGWPEEGAAWITPQRLAARITWAMEAPPLLVTPPEPTELARRALGTRAEAGLLAAAARAETRAEGVGLVLASPAFNRR